MRAPALIILTGLTLGAAACATVEVPVEPSPGAAAFSAPAPVADHLAGRHLRAHASSSSSSSSTGVNLRLWKPVAGAILRGEASK